MRRLVYGFVLCAVFPLAASEGAGAEEPPKQDRTPQARSADQRPAGWNGRRAVGRPAAPPVDGGAVQPASSLRLSSPGNDEAAPAAGDRKAPEILLRLPSSTDIVDPADRQSPAAITARYLPPHLAEPDRPAQARRWEIDLPDTRKYWSPGPFVHPAGKSDLSASCVAPPDPSWLSMLKANWALDGYGNAEPLPGQASYWPFRCY